MGDTLKLNQKFTLAVFGVVLVPVVLLAMVLFSNTRRLITEDKLQDVESGLLQLQTGVDKAVDLCNMTTQIFLNSTSLKSFLLAARQDYPFTMEELLAFYRGDVASFERMVNANPYLHQVRVFYDNPALPEMMPILYHTDRMARLRWAREDWAPGTWQYDYEDTLFLPEVSRPALHVMSLVTTVEDFELGRLGVLEVSVRMEEILPRLYQPHSEYSCFVSDRGGWYHSGEDADFWQQHRGDIAAFLEDPVREIRTRPLRLGQTDYWVTTAPLSSLGGWFVVVTPPSELTGQLTQFQWLFLLGMLLLLALLALSVNWIVKAMLRRFYLAFDTIVAIRDGDLEARAPDLGRDEMGMLGTQLNLMLDRIDQLVRDNLDRQLLAKDAELRALQNQINAHFIYNVLESIRMTAEVEGQYLIADALQSLGALMRYSTRWTSATVTLAEEVDNIRNYLTLVNLRYDYRVALHCDLPPEVLAQRIPKMTLQPLVENAVQHGLYEAAQDSALVLSARREEEALLLTLTDRGKGMESARLAELRAVLEGDRATGDGRSIGLKNVQDRLVMAFGPAYGLALESQPGAGTQVNIRIPYGSIQEAQP